MRHIGVDLHKTNFVVCFLNEDESCRLESFPLSKTGIKQFVEQLNKTDSVAVEATQNIYYFYDQIKAAVARVVLVDTYRFSVIAKSKKKTDKADALALARFLKLDHLPEVSVPGERVRQLPASAASQRNAGRVANEAEESGTRCFNEKRHRADAFGICLTNSARAIAQTR